jgi:FKBP-type peptidyl-prolyl cis-trans isomerase
MKKLSLLLLIAACAPTVQRAAPTKPPVASGIPAPPDVAAPPADAEVRSSGLATKVLKEGTGDERPWTHDKVVVHYTGWTTDGRMFDSSVDRGQPATFGVDQVVPGWSEGVMLMVEGETRRMWIPEALAYKGKAPKGMLVFDVTLIKIKH